MVEDSNSTKIYWNLPCSTHCSDTGDTAVDKANKNLFPVEFTLEKGGNFPGGAVIKNLPASAGDMGSIPGPGRSHMPRSH